MSTTFSTSTQVLQDFLGDFHPRKLLLQTPLSKPLFVPSPLSISAREPSGSEANNDYLDTHVVIILSVIVCAVFCSLGLHFLVKCALQCLILRHGAGNSATTSTTSIVNNGVKQKTLKTFLVMNFSLENKLPRLDTECVICLSEFVIGDPVRILPKCNHGFHIKCIDKWLSSHSSCPTCRHSLNESCLKVEDCSQASSTTSSGTRNHSDFCTFGG